MPNFPNLSDNQAWSQMSALNGNDGSWAEWQNIIIHVPEDKNALSDEPFNLSPPATIQPTEEKATAPPEGVSPEKTPVSEKKSTAKSETWANLWLYLLFFGALVVVITLIVFFRRRQEK